jgi:hypothetical protein
METKQCSKCKLIKPLSEFYPDKRAKSGKYSECRECWKLRTHTEKHREYSQKWWREHAEQIKAKRAKNKSQLPSGMKRCSMCKLVKPYCEFGQATRTKSGCSSKCKECNRIYNRKWYQKNLEKRRAYCNELQHKRRNVPSIRLNLNMSSLIYMSLHGNKNGHHWENLVGYTLEDLKTHLEKQFISNMSWSNYGNVWHIDHIIPLSAFMFSTSEDLAFKQCWSLYNLRPMWASVNISKGNKLDPLLVKKVIKQWNIGKQDAL